MEEKQCYLMHELMNCLTVVLGECELLQMKTDMQGTERLAIIRERANHMAQLLRHYDCAVEYKPAHDGFLRTLVRAAGLRVEQ